MFMIYKIDYIEKKEFRKDLYGMFLIHQEKCRVNEVYDYNNEIDFKCPCGEIIEFIQKLNFHFKFNSKNINNQKFEKNEHKENIDEKEKIVEKDNKSIKGSQINDALKDENEKNKKKFELDKNENDSVEMQQEKSENKAMKIREYYKNCFEQLKQKLYHYIKFLLVYHIINKPRTIKLHLLYSYLCHKKLNKPFKSLYELMQANLSKGSFVDKYLVFRQIFLIIFRYTEILESDINELNSKKEKDYYMDIKDFIEFVLSYKSYFAIMENIVSDSVEFWQEMLVEKPNSIKFYKLGHNIAKDYIFIKKHREFFEDKYHNHFAIAFAYGCFLKYVLNNQKEANILIANCLENKVKLDFSITLATDIRTNDEAGLIIIKSDLLHIGEVVYINKNLSLQLGFTANELIHSNVNLIMPQFIGIKHDMYLKNFLETGEKNFLDKESIMFAKDKSGFLIPIKLLIRMIPNLTSGLKFIGQCIRLKTNSEILKPDPDLKCNDLFFILTDLNYKFLGVSENTATDLGLIFNNSTVKKFKEIILESIIINLKDVKNQFENLEDYVRNYLKKEKF